MNIRIRLFGLTLFEHYHTCDENCIPKNQIAGVLKEHAEQHETIRLLLEEREGPQIKRINGKDMIFWKIEEQSK